MTQQTLTQSERQEYVQRQHVLSKHWPRSPHRQHHIHHIHCQRYESRISLAASQSDTDDGSEIDVIYHNLPAVTENLSISSQVMEASSNVKDQRVDEGTFGIFSEIISNNRVSTNTSPAISNQLVEVEKWY